MLSFPKERICKIYSITVAKSGATDTTKQRCQFSNSKNESQPRQPAFSCSFNRCIDHTLKKHSAYLTKYSFTNTKRSAQWKSILLAAFPISLLTLIIMVVVLYFAPPPAISVFYLGGSVEIPNLTYTSELGDSKTHQFLQQAAVVQNYFSELYDSSSLGKYYLNSVITAFSEGKDGLRAYFWSKFWAPLDIAHQIKNSTSSKLKKYASKKMPLYLNYSDELSSMEDNFDFYTDELFASGSDEYDISVKSAISFDLYAKPGNNRTLTLKNPKKSYYQWRLRVPPNNVVRLVVLTLHEASPGNCATHKLTAYDYLLPSPKKLISRWCGVPVSWAPPVTRLTSSSNVMLVTFSSDRNSEQHVFKAYFQAVAKADCGGSLSSWNGTITSPYYPSHYPPNVDCTWTIKAPVGYSLMLDIFVVDIQDKSPGSSKCDNDWLDINGVTYCNSMGDIKKSKIHDPFVTIHFHSDESVTRKGFYIEYRAFSYGDPCPKQFKCKDGTCIPMRSQCNGWKDCIDGSDEQDCDCGSEELSCINGKCKQNKMCSGENECDDDSRESDCMHKSCSSLGFRCLDGKCVNKPHAECDGVKDCSDGSDEVNCACGTRPRKKTKIVGGEDARSGKWPWQVSLQMGMYGHICGASLVSNRWLISAAHCFLDSDSIRYSAASQWKAYMGMRVINKLSSNMITRSIRKILIHPQYDEYTSDYDIALLELSSPVFFNDVIQPICLPLNPQFFYLRTTCYVTGWGAVKENGELAKILQEARVRVVSQNICNKLYDDAVTPRMMCAGNLHGGTDACQGDSGGPLACRGRKNKWFLAGIVSWGEGCARRNRPGVYTQVSGLYDWIRQQIN
ncbi:suppressor of tumorigenicity 14 protein homolog [Protopterus annectens]|uniref:suppressor of tumorigenicity 14 protein homolog n=1 Tax=Protopterus annectens TaxID=7888 RepID=UPI001CF9CA04|nr:suppressor of tumorigenicity 14 protein homolog [Protopterus annectens]